MEEFTNKIKCIMLSVIMMYAFVIQQAWARELLGFWYLVMCVVQISLYFLNKDEISIGIGFIQFVLTGVAFAGFGYFGHYLYASATGFVLVLTVLRCADWRKQ